MATFFQGRSSVCSQAQTTARWDFSANVSRRLLHLSPVERYNSDSVLA